MTQDEIMQALAAPFAAKDVEWRAGKGSAGCIPTA